MCSTGRDDDGYPIQNMHHSWDQTIDPAAIVHSVDVTDIEYQIRCIEMEAYTAVLKAFTAQADVLSWDKEGLMSDLRKELRVSDIEHRELRVKVDSDDSVRMIRQEWRKGMVCQKEIFPDAKTPSVPGLLCHPYNKRRKCSQITAFSAPNLLSFAQPASGVIPSSFATHSVESQWGDEASASFKMGSAVQPMKSVVHNGQMSFSIKGRGSGVVQPRKNCQPSNVTNFNTSCDKIEIRTTDILIHEVEKLTSGERPDPVQVEKAKLLLREHEREILVALEKLAGISEADEYPDGWFSHQESNEHPKERKWDGIPMGMVRMENSVIGDR
ncbi:hypothetical protein Sjap_013036 [Stephania japonica]|uniref:ENT domain-containing protein n=1 Tax=Stephania japonica TaxID=461633 RepID=A0AAP0IX95_9MAGN